MLSLLSLRQEEFEGCRDAVRELVVLAEKDSEEVRVSSIGVATSSLQYLTEVVCLSVQWVRIGAGMVQQFLFLDAAGRASDGFFHDQLARTTATVVAAVATPDESRARTLDDVASLENALLNPSIRPEPALKPAMHFTVSAAPDAGHKRDGHDGQFSPSCTSMSRYWHRLMVVWLLERHRTAADAKEAAAPAADGAAARAPDRDVVGGERGDADAADADGPQAAAAQEERVGRDVRDPTQGRRWPVQAPAQPHLDDRH